MSDYQMRLSEHLARYKTEELEAVPTSTGTTRGNARGDAHTLAKGQLELNILPGIRERFWPWFRNLKPRIRLDPDFNRLDSSQALAFNLFFPFLGADGTHVDARLLKALGIPEGSFNGYFERVLVKAETTSFDFYIEGSDGRRFFFELQLAETEFGSCRNDARQCERFETHYRPYLAGQVDDRWLENTTFFANYRTLRNLSFLGRYPGSGVVFIYPQANEALSEADETIKKIASKTLAPRVAILYLEYLVARILTLTEDDADLQRHFMQFREKYVIEPGLGSS